MGTKLLRMVFLSIHSSPLGQMGTKDTGGMSAYLLGLSRALGEAGHQVDIFTRGSGEKGSSAQEVFPGVRLITLHDGLGPLAKEDIYPESNKLAALLLDYIGQNRLQYDLIFSHYWLSGCVGRVVNEKLKLPHLIMYHTLGRAKNESCPAEKEPPQRLKEEEALARQCDLIVTAAPGEKERVAGYFKLSREKIAVVPCGVDFSLFKPLARKDAKGKLGLSSKRVILAVGRIEPVKGFEHLISSAALLPPEDNFSLVIVGGDHFSENSLAALKKQATGSGLAGSIVFTGRLDHHCLPLYYNAADVTVIASVYESFGMVALESLACGTPLVAGPVGIIPELLKADSPNLMGIIVENRNPADWAVAIRRLYLRHQTISREEIFKQLAPYNWQASAEKLIVLYKRIINSL